MQSIQGTALAGVVDAIEAHEFEDALPLFKALSEEESILVFEFLSFGIQKKLLQALPSQQVATLLNKISPDDRTGLLEEFSPDLVNQLLKYLTPEERALSIHLLGYPENSVGRLMTPDYIAVKMEWTVREALEYIRKKGKDSETINVIYAIDDRGYLIDDFRIRQFLLADPEKHVRDLGDYTFLALRVDEEVETAIQIFNKFGRVALPVTDGQGLLLGIVTIDDIMNASIEKDTSEMQKMGAVTAFKEPYMSLSFFHLMKKRVGWLIILFLGELMTASAMGHFQDVIAKAVVLTLFIPLIISSGGNAGSQASTLIIRALSLGEVTLKDWWRIMHREIFAGLFLGCVLGSIGFLRVVLWNFFYPLYGSHYVLVGWTVFLTILGVVLWGTLTGSMFPLLLKRCGFDPATSSAPFVATVVDVTGIIIYFSAAYLLLHGTLL